MHYHLLAICRECGSNLSGPFEDLEKVTEALKTTKELATNNPDFKLFGTTANVVEFTVTSKSGKTHEYVVTYVYCKVPFEVCVTVDALKEAAESGKLDTMMRKALDEFLAKNPDIKKPEGFEPPSKGFDILNN